VRFAEPAFGIFEVIVVVKVTGFVCCRELDRTRENMVTGVCVCVCGWGLLLRLGNAVVLVVAVMIMLWVGLAHNCVFILERWYYSST
jgi:hypothetical protein